ncbi:MAG: hypothetical protein GY787_11505 [Alteromonadales bacterium]|nr:hypothetical protein [Alteromonadales bacterium]
MEKQNTALLKDLKSGLEMAVDDGSFDEYIRTHESSKHLIPINRWINTKTIKIPNPFLSPETDINNSRYRASPLKL